MSSTHSNGTQLTEQSTTFLLAATLSWLDAEKWGVIPDIEVDTLARISYLYASQSIHVDKEQFLAGFKQGYADYLAGLV